MGGLNLRGWRARPVWLAISLTSFVLVAGSFVLTAHLNLHPCHLCIFQRLLYMALALFGMLSFFMSGITGRAASYVVALLSMVGVGVAAYQTWLQAQPPGSISCMAGEPGLIERLVEWLGQQAPELFLATGFCEEAELTILGLTLANWSLLGFVVFLLAAILALFSLLLTRP